jgi:hypothetical protein
MPVYYVQPEKVAPTFAEVASSEIGCPVIMGGSIRHYCSLVNPSGAWITSAQGEGYVIDDRLTAQRPRPWRGVFRFDLDKMDCGQHRRLKERALEFVESLGPVRSIFLGDIQISDLGYVKAVAFILYGRR